jgi:hypothetical protein
MFHFFIELQGKHTCKFIPIMLQTSDLWENDKLENFRYFQIRCYIVPLALVASDSENSNSDR